jgi:hypothetical protein
LDSIWDFHAALYLISAHEGMTCAIFPALHTRHAVRVILSDPYRLLFSRVQFNVVAMEWILYAHTLSLFTAAFHRQRPPGFYGTLIKFNLNN